MKSTVGSGCKVITQDADNFDDPRFDLKLRFYFRFIQSGVGSVGARKVFCEIESSLNTWNPTTRR